MIGSGLIGNGHSIDTLTMSFRYSAGYTGVGKEAPTLRIALVDMVTGKELKSLYTSEPLGNYSYDHFTGYSPEIAVKATGIDLPNPNAAPVIVAMIVSNNQRNLQIPVDDKAQGFNIHVTWKAAAEPSAVAAAAAVPAAAVPQKVAVGGANNLGSVIGLGQLWAKKQPNGASAALLINHGGRALTHTVSLKKLNLTGSEYAVRDIWAHKDLAAVKGDFNLTVPAYDSTLVLLAPA